MLKKIISICIVAIMLCAPMVVLGSPDNARMVVGGNLSEEQISEVYKLVEVEQGSVDELKVTIDEERSYLKDLVPDDKIGKRSISCVYIEIQTSGGVRVKTKNIDWLTSDMYMSAITTAGIDNAYVSVAAPFNVSGTAALTGIYKAYEDITGKKLGEEEKQVAFEELVVTGELSDSIGQEDAVVIVNELKNHMGEIQNMTNVEIENLIINIAHEKDIKLSEDDIKKIRELIEKFKGLNIDSSVWQQRSKDLQNAFESIASSDFFKSIGDFFTKIWEWVVSLFG